MSLGWNEAHLQALIDGFFTADSLLATCIELEEYFMKMNASLQKTEACLTSRTDALVRATDAFAL